MNRIPAPVLRVFCLMVMAPTAAFAADPPPGSKAEVPVSNATSLRFVFCPGGAVRLGDPTGDSPELPVAGFYMMQHELTVGQFNALASPKTAQDLQSRPERLNLSMNASYLQDDRSAVLMTTLTDAVEVCQRLEDEYLKSNPVAFELRAFRLPSQFEWQHACRGGAASEKPHFGGWPENWRTLPAPPSHDATMPDLCNSAWSELGLREKYKRDFSGSQEDVVEMMTEATKPEKSAELPYQIFVEFITAGFQVERQPDDAAERIREKQPAIERDGTPTGWANAWSLHRMHDNISEWVVLADEPAQARDLWSQVNVENASKMRVAKAGGSFDALRSTWFRFTIWKWAEDSQHVFDGLTDDKAAQQTCGFRLIMERKLSPDWFALLRKSIRKDVVDAALPSLNTFHRDIEQLVPSNEVQKTRQVVDFYRGLASQMTGTEPPPQSGDLSNQSAYFKYFQHVLDSQ